jgi:hypothetical protein
MRFAQTVAETRAANVRGCDVDANRSRGVYMGNDSTMAMHSIAGSHSCVCRFSVVQLSVPVQRKGSRPSTRSRPSRFEVRRMRSICG